MVRWILDSLRYRFCCRRPESGRKTRNSLHTRTPRHCSAHEADGASANDDQPEPWRLRSRRPNLSKTAVALDDKYTQQSGDVYMSSIQALVRLPIMQRQRDAAAGLNTAGFISGYRGSPIGTYDQALWRGGEGAGGGGEGVRRRGAA